MVNSIIETFDLSKKYKLKRKKKEIIALNKANLSVKEGEIFGLLGPNGSGKTTIISILTTLLKPTSGYALIDSYNILKNPNKTKSKVALMLDNKMLFNRVTGYDNLKFCCKLYKVPNYKQRIRTMAKEFGLEKWLDQYVEKYSRGMKLKLALIRTLILDRKILFLDEPTLGLDVKSIYFVIEKLKKLKNTIFLTSHDMTVVEKLCDRIAFIDKGKIIKIGTSEDIKKFEQKEIVVKIKIINDKSELISELSQNDFILEAISINNGIKILLNEKKNFNNLFSILSKYDVLGINEQSLSMEELFLKITH